MDFWKQRSRHPLETTARQRQRICSGHGASVFTSSKPWVPYWALGALGATEAEASPPSGISAGDLTCFVDRQPFSPGAGMSIYPDAAGLPGRARTTWQRTQLPGVGDQSDTFGVEQFTSGRGYHTQAIYPRPGKPETF